MLDSKEICKVSTLLNAVANPIRLKIILLISETKRPLHIKAVAKILKGNYAAIYRHVKILQESGLIGIYEVGRSRVLYPKDETLISLVVDFIQKITQIR
ncbi:TPA: ArsR family transcriptional regulator [Candidatus Bathyarchaeota archaeon]|nr:ArsR family transcriptional regulator [Candidatus Bathyarchaeota archaeon]